MRKTIILLALALVFSMIIMDTSYGAGGDNGSSCIVGATAGVFNSCSAGTTFGSCFSSVGGGTADGDGKCRCKADYFVKTLADPNCTSCGLGATKVVSGSFATVDSVGGPCNCASGGVWTVANVGGATAVCACGTYGTNDAVTKKCVPNAFVTCAADTACACVANATKNANSSACTCNASFTGDAASTACTAASSTTTTTTDTAEGDDETASFALQPIIAALMVAAVALFA